MANEGSHGACREPASTRAADGAARAGAPPGTTPDPLEQVHRSTGNQAVGTTVQRQADEGDGNGEVVRPGRVHAPALDGRRHGAVLTATGTGTVPLTY